MMSERMPVQVALDHENYIPVPRHQMLARLQQDVPEADRGDFLQFSRLLGGVYHFEFHEFAQQLLERYFFLDPKNQQLSSKATWMREIDFEKEEEEFLLLFFQLMQKANYKPLSQQDIDFAEEENYLFTLPVQIDWSRHDDQLLGQFLRNHSELIADADRPEYADKILLFRRGTQVDQTTRVFLLEKLDKILSEWVLKQFQRIGRLFGKSESRDTSEKPAKVPPVVQEDMTERSRSTIFETRLVERRSLRNSDWKLFERTTLQEPTFEQLVVLFRFKTPPSSKKNPAPEKDRAIHIKMFRDIPMADLEVIFPEKKLSMKPKDLVSLVLTALMGIGVTAYKIFFTAVVSPVLALVALAGLGGYAAKVTLGYKNSKARYQSLVTSTLYDKNLDNEAGVIHTLLASMEDQEFLEAILAYFFLWQQGPLSEDELDARCERFIHEKFGLEVDFEVSDALDKLEKQGLLLREEDRLRVLPLRAALETLDHKWDNYFQFNTGSASVESH